MLNYSGIIRFTIHFLQSACSIISDCLVCSEHPDWWVKPYTNNEGLYSLACFLWCVRQPCAVCTVHDVPIEGDKGCYCLSPRQNFWDCLKSYIRVSIFPRMFPIIEDQWFIYKIYTVYLPWNGLFSLFNIICIELKFCNTVHDSKKFVSIEGGGVFFRSKFST